MPERKSTSDQLSTPSKRCRVAVIWIDWYAYHFARFRGLQSTPALAGSVRGIELVGGVGVHEGLNFREGPSDDPAVTTLLPECSWKDADKWSLAVRLWHHLTLLDPDLVLVPGYYTLPAIAAAVWARINHRKSVLMTESTAEDHVRSWWKESLKGLLIRTLFDSAIVGGKAHMRYLENLGFSPEHIQHSYDVVDNHLLAERSSTVRELSAGASKLPSRYILFVGRLAPEKNVGGLLTEWHQYRNAGGTWPILIVGSGPLTDTLHASASISPFANDIYFAGHKGYKELPAFYAFASCFILPSVREPWGLVVNEAMAAGLPVIVSNRCGCAEDLVHAGHNGFIFDPFTSGEAAACLLHFESLEREQQEMMGSYSKTIVSNYSPESFGKQVALIAAE